MQINKQGINAEKMINAIPCFMFSIFFNVYVEADNMNNNAISDQSS